SAVLPAKLLAFLRSEKQADREASVPELIRRVHVRGIFAEDEPVSRVSVWRAWAYRHRMLMVLADGKHFRTCVHHLRRADSPYCRSLPTEAVPGSRPSSSAATLEQVEGRIGLRRYRRVLRPSLHRLGRPSRGPDGRARL